MKKHAFEFICIPQVNFFDFGIAKQLEISSFSESDELKHYQSSNPFSYTEAYIENVFSRLLKGYAEAVSVIGNSFMLAISIPYFSAVTV